LDVAILIILWCSGTLGKSYTSDFFLANTTNGTDFISKQNLILTHSLTKQKIASQVEVINNTVIDYSNDLIKNRSNQPRSYNNVSTTPFIS
jgi:hypothetical protein